MRSVSIAFKCYEIEHVVTDTQLVPNLLRERDDYIRASTELADMHVVMARWDDAAASHAAGLRAEALLASWPFGSVGPSQKNREIEHVEYLN